jgi:hypothetical protein
MFSSSGIPTNELAFMLVNYDEVSTRIHITVLRKEGSEAGAYLGPNQLPAEDVPKKSHFWPQKTKARSHVPISFHASSRDVHPFDLHSYTERMLLKTLI